MPPLAFIDRLRTIVIKGLALGTLSSYTGNVLKTRPLILLLLFFALFFIFLRLSFDPDLGWHLRLGKIFLETGQVVYANDLTWTFKGYVWPHSYFFYDALVTYLLAKIGFLALALAFAFACALAVLWVLPKKLSLVNLLLVLLGGACASSNLGVRPHVFSFVFFLVLLVILERRIYEKIRFWPLIFGLFVLWTNFHPGFVTGFFVLSFYIIVDWFWRRGRSEENLNKRAFWIIPISFLATLVSPFNFGTWMSMFALNIGRANHITNIAEWESVALFFPVNILFGLTGLVFCAFIYKKFKDLSPAWVLVGAVIFAVSFILSAFTFFWGAYFLFFFSRIYGKVFLGKYEKGFCLALVVAMVPLLFWIGQDIVRWRGYADMLVRGRYPVGALEYMRSEGRFSQMKIFETYGWGGYMDWFAPEYKMFVDGRMANWSDNVRPILADYLDIAGTKCDAAARYDFDLVLVEADFSGKCFDSYNVIYQDSVSRILVKENR